ncbi:hypothetical protein IGI04_011974 [Brassica rapa subsp. trilocularis]|uniref:Uncharacterized protein n=1 Tax=Brassica rapa subsp. trilocularis TaxID=1813537 RepID=A0ABQ7N4P6_BRACM|nr:hypothetical protein IGI04_011974 [Brassica rapa subsp. trilocularis]
MKEDDQRSHVLKMATDHFGKWYETTIAATLSKFFTFQDKSETLSETKESDGKESVEKAKDERKCYQNTRNQKTRMMQPTLLNHTLKTTVPMYSNSNVNCK